MLTKGKTSRFFFVLLFTIFLNLVFSGNSQADLAISGSGQMAAGTTQTVTVSGGSGPYSWGVASGGGSISGTSGASADFTASASNYNCLSIPVICVTDFVGEVSCKQIAVTTTSYATTNAYYYTHPLEGNPYPCATCWPHLGYCYGVWTYTRSNYNCFDEHISDVAATSEQIDLTPYGCGFKAYYGCRPPGADVPACTAAEVYAAETQHVGEYVDVRSAEMKESGCCPSGVGGGSSGTDSGPGTNDEGSGAPGNGDDSGSGNPGTRPGDSSSTPGTRLGDNTGTGTPNTTVCSEVNLKSGNLYVSKEVAGIALSYNSLDTISGSLGPKWTHNYDLNLTVVESNTTLRLKREDGNITYFRNSGGIYYPEAISGDASKITYAGNVYTRTFKNGIKQQFNSSGKLISITDRNNNVTTLTYNSNNLVITDKNNRTTTIAFTNGKITSITDHAGKTYNIGYDTNGRLATISCMENVLWQYTYDTASGRMTSRKDVPNNWTWTYAYYTNGANAGKLHTVTDENGKIREVTYVSATQTNLKEKDEGVWQYTFDPIYGVKTAVTDPLGHTTQYKYDLKRNLTKVIHPAPDSGMIIYTYDPNNSNLLSVTDASEKTTSYDYSGNSFNLVHLITDPNGHVTQYDYDTKGNLLTITQYGDPGTSDDDAVTTFTYDTKGNVTSITTPQQNKTTQRATAMMYDTNNNDLLTIDDPDPNKGPVYMTYYPMGNPHTYTDPLNHTTTFGYNDLHQLVNIKDHQQHETNYTYDHRGNRLSVQDANGKVTNFTYDFNNQITGIKQYINNVEKVATLSHSGSGCSACTTGVDKLNSVKDAKNQESRFEYNQTGNVVTATDPLGKSTTYTYDERNNLKTRIDGDGRMITYTYYPNNRLWQKLYSGGDTITYQYDDTGNMTYSSNASIAYTMIYDAFNRLKTITANGRTIEYQYNADGSRIQMKIIPDNITYNYAYDDDGNLTTITTPQGNFTFTYDASNRRATRTAPNGTTSIYSYDTINRLTGIETKQGTTTLDYVNYTRLDNVGNRMTKVSPQESWAYIYDDIYRLTNATPTGDTHQPENYTYDDVGNRLTSGNQQFPQANATTNYTYDNEHRLTGVTVMQGSNVKQLTFVYDSFGRRIAKTIVQDTISTDCASPKVCPRTTNYVYDGPSIIMEYDQSNTVIATYTHGPGIDEPLAVQKGTNTYYYHTDGLGSITSLTNSSGSVMQTYTYDSFGNITVSGSISQPYAFTGREYDSETGMYFYRARYYDPKVGRFVTKDPIGFAGGINVYNYVGANPVNWGDPSGKAPAWDHFFDGYNLGRNSGSGVIDSLIRGWNEMMVDYGKYADEDAIHDTTYNPLKSSKAVNQEVEDLINSAELNGHYLPAEDIQAVIDHAGLDLRTPEHNGSYYGGWRKPIGSTGHVFGEIWDSIFGRNGVTRRTGPETGSDTGCK